MSPDGKRAIAQRGKRFGLIDFKTGAFGTINWVGAGTKFA
jgi:hypothetical protein